VAGLAPGFAVAIGVAVIATVLSPRLGAGRRPAMSSDPVAVSGA
jgi:hypothetical protein